MPLGALWMGSLLLDYQKGLLSGMSPLGISSLPWSIEKTLRAGTQRHDIFTSTQTRDHPYVIDIRRFYRLNDLARRQIISSLWSFRYMQRSSIDALSLLIPLNGQPSRIIPYPTYC